MSSLASNANTTENKLFIENYKILQTSKEADTGLSHNYHTVDLVTGKLTNVALNELLLALKVRFYGDYGKRWSYRTTAYYSYYKKYY